MDEKVIDADFSKITEGTIFKKTLGDIEDNDRCGGYNRSRDRSREGSLSRDYSNNKDRS